MHRSCSLGLPAPRNLPAVPGAAWEPEDLASFTLAACMVIGSGDIRFVEIAGCPADILKPMA